MSHPIAISDKGTRQKVLPWLDFALMSDLQNYKSNVTHTNGSSLFRIALTHNAAAAGAVVVVVFAVTLEMHALRQQKIFSFYKSPWLLILNRLDYKYRLFFRLSFPIGLAS